MISRSPALYCNESEARNQNIYGFPGRGVRGVTILAQSVFFNAYKNHGAIWKITNAGASLYTN